MSDEKRAEHHKVVIIGSGPAGYTAAIYAARAGLNPIMYTGREVGGQLVFTTEVENYPGYPEGTQGPEMMEDLRRQAERFGTEIRYALIAEADVVANPKRLVDDGGDVVFADAVIIATGATAKWLDIPGEDRFKLGGGVTACAVCDGFFYRGETVVVVGGGDTAAEEATYLASLCKEVNLLIRSDKMRASKIMQQRVFDTPNIKIHWNTSPIEVVGIEKVAGVRVKDNKTGDESVIECKGYFAAIGHKPNTDIFTGQLDMNETGYILTKGKSTHTNIEGVFASGDAQDFTYRQAITAAGTGCMAALDAERWLKEHGLH